MSNSTTNTIRRTTLRYRGFRIRIHNQGKPSTDLPIIFAPDIPARWNEIKQDSSIVAATLYRSGRVFAHHSQ